MNTKTNKQTFIVKIPKKQENEQRTHYANNNHNKIQKQLKRTDEGEYK